LFTSPAWLPPRSEMFVRLVLVKIFPNGGVAPPPGGGWLARVAAASASTWAAVSLCVREHPEIYGAGDLAWVTDPRTGHVLHPLARVAVEEGATV
jgi:NADH dehydrogenase FAD-containing subunit